MPVESESFSCFPHPTWSRAPARARSPHGNGREATRVNPVILLILLAKASPQLSLNGRAEKYTLPTAQLKSHVAMPKINVLRSLLPLRQ